MKRGSELTARFSRQASGAELRRELLECRFEPLRLRWPALRHILRSPATPAEAHKRFFHQCAHVERLARGLGKH